MFDYSKINGQILDYISGYEDDFDIDGIMDELREMEIRDIDDLDTGEWNDLMSRHDVSGN